MKKFFTLSVYFVLIGSIAHAQDDMSNLFNTAPADATKLSEAYMSSLFKGFGNSLNGGWTNTAKTKGLFHFDIRVSVSGSVVPESDKSFDFTKIGLSSSLGPTTKTQSTITPTFGGSGKGASISIYAPNDPGQTKPITTFNLPPAVTSIVPVPQLQATVGLVQNTDVTLRLIPKISFGSDFGSMDMIGFGIKHDIAQDFAKLTRPIPFDVAIAFGYTRLNYNFNVHVTPLGGAKPKDSQQSTDFSGQTLSGHFSGINVAAIISKKILFFTPFLSLGYATSSTEIGAYGNYPVTTGIDNIVTQNPVYTTYNNPIYINETSLSGARIDAGFQLSLAVFKIYASYSAAQYQSINAGIGLGL